MLARTTTISVVIRICCRHILDCFTGCRFFMCHADSQIFTRISNFSLADLDLLSVPGFNFPLVQAFRRYQLLIRLEGAKLFQGEPLFHQKRSSFQFSSSAFTVIVFGIVSCFNGGKSHNSSVFVCVPSDSFNCVSQLMVPGHVTASNLQRNEIQFL